MDFEHPTFQGVHSWLQNHAEHFGDFEHPNLTG